jgi:hypothetical protein
MSTNDLTQRVAAMLQKIEFLPASEGNRLVELLTAYIETMERATSDALLQI